MNSTTQTRADQKAATARAVLEAARNAFERVGFEDASLRDIAAEAGVSAGTVVHHYGEKRDLLHAALFSDLDKLVLDYAVGMSRTPVEVSDELFGKLRQHFDDAQLVELTHLIAVENMYGRFNHALGVRSAGFSEGMVCAAPATTFR